MKCKCSTCYIYWEIASNDKYSDAETIWQGAILHLGLEDCGHSESKQNIRAIFPAECNRQAEIYFWSKESDLPIAHEIIYSGDRCLLRRSGREILQYRILRKPEEGSPAQLIGAAAGV